MQELVEEKRNWLKVKCCFVALMIVYHWVGVPLACGMDTRFFAIQRNNFLLR